MAADPDGELTVTLATRSDGPLIACLLNDYLAELKSHREVDIGASDAASYPYFEAYWREAERSPFIIHHSGEIVGFVFVRRRPADDPPMIELAELYIKPAYRRRGLGRAVLGELSRRYPGDWELQVLAKNTGALGFWASSIESVTQVRPTTREIQSRDGRRVQFNFHVTRALPIRNCR